ncbi:hypothetical protein VTJ83DRAFT_5592 [Remersonia thermophila]|uniref:Uncharacterized protein n=1 Tax=Remersonia thermophila TaxID=72144 RepID=A0ABR4D7D2_9PEZI
MADVDSSSATTWYSWLVNLGILPGESHYIIRFISSFFISLAVIPIVPVVLMFIYDVSLWLWRITAAQLRRRHARVAAAPHVQPPAQLSDTT